LLFLAAFIPFWFVEIQSPNFPPFKIAGGYSTEAVCQAELPEIESEWSAKTYGKGHAKRGQNTFGKVVAVCKKQDDPNKQH
jgi:hypothetical protein